MVTHKLAILKENELDEFRPHLEALFNPNQITLNRAAKWPTRAKGESDTGSSRFAYAEPVTLSMDLFFDTYRNTYKSNEDVRQYTDKLFELTTIEKHGKLHRPPLCMIQWGSFDLSDDFKCSWVLQNLSQRFTLFFEDGAPARVTASCSFRQWRGDEFEKKLLGLESADVPKRRTVRRGETLTSIAAEEYNDPTLWRTIAEANEIDSPGRLAPGQTLAIPALRVRGSAR